MKRPAAGSKKRPAAASINETVEKLRRGVSKANLEEDDQETNVGEEETEEMRDKAKGQRYARMRSTLPQHVVDLVERVSSESICPRSAKTKAINKLFRKNSSGKLVLNLQDQLFVEHKKIFSKQFSKETDTCLPESILKGLYLHNDNNAFQEAKDRGDIVAVESPLENSFLLCELFVWHLLGGIA